MNILIINHHTNIEKYGSSSRHFTIGKKLSLLGHNILLVGSSYNQRENKYIHKDLIKYDEINEKFAFLSIRSRPEYANTPMRLLNYIDFTIKSAFVKPNFKPDIVVGSSVHPFVWISAYRIAKKYNAEFHIEVRDIWPLSLLEDLPVFSRELIMNISKYYEKYFYNKAKSIIVTAPLAHRYIEDKFNIDKSKVNYVPHGIDISRFDELSEENTSEVSLPDRVNITYTGALSSSEGLENFIQLAKEFKNNNNIHFNIIGDGNQKNKLNDMVTKLKLENITFYGHVQSQFIPSILRESDILWCGLKSREAFKYSISKNKFYDYLASCNPIIFHSDVKDSPLEQSDAAFIVPLNRLPINELSQLISNGKLRETMGNKGRKFVVDNHEISIISKRYIHEFNTR